MIVMSSGQANAEIMSERRTALTCRHEQPIMAMREKVSGSLTGHYHKGVGSDDLNMVMVTAYENHPADSRITETGNISQQLTSRMGTGGNNVPLVQKLSERSSVRRLTPTECERLQGFPDGWTDGQADSHRYKQMGNAVTVNVAEWIGKRIAEAHNGVAA